MKKNFAYSSAIKKAALWEGVIGLLLFQTGLYALFSDRAIVSSAFLRPLYYGFWFISGVTAITVVAIRPSIGRRLFPLYSSLLVIAAITLIYAPFGMTSRSLLLFSYSVGVLTTLFVGAEVDKILRFAAVIAAVTAGALMLEMFFPGYLSSTAGRSAGMLVNPNVAAVALLLAGTASVPFVTERWRCAFAILIVAGVLSTMSRTSIFVLVGAAIASEIILWFWRRSNVLTLSRAQILRTSLTAVMCLAVIFLALQTNTTTRTALLGSASTTFDVFEVPESVDREANPLTAANELGETNSGAARLLLMSNAIQKITIIGRGAEYAHSIAPHNEYIFFVVAFGVFGAISIFLLLYSIVMINGRNVLFVLSLIFVLLFTHDLTVIAIAVSMALGCTGGIQNPSQQGSI